MVECFYDCGEQGRSIVCWQIGEKVGESGETCAAASVEEPGPVAMGTSVSTVVRVVAASQSCKKVVISCCTAAVVGSD